MNSASATTLTTLHSMGYGAMLGAGLLGTAHTVIPIVHDAMYFPTAVLLGGLLGGGLHGVGSVIFKLMLRPAGRYVELFWRLTTIVFLREAGVLSQERAAILVDTAIDKVLVQ